MELMRRLWVYPYKTGSEMAKMIADYCGVLQIKKQNSEFEGKEGQFILNWGAGSGNYNANTGKATLLNPPELVDIAINKVSYFEHMVGPGGPRVPYWTTNQQVAKWWLKEGREVIARTKIDGARGDGIIVMKKPLDFVWAPLYTIKVGNVVHEYRVYMFGDQMIDYRIKEGKKVDGMFVGINAEFTIPDAAIPVDVALQAKRASRKLPLILQGLDIIWDGERAWVLETNTAPWLGTRIASRYAKALNDYIEERP